ncbi:MAG: lipopolysaccharide heptosyltransferase II [Nitrospirae bacterium]|nr:lipopolysaccharide heptosyltransferase II [Nitrospirota bacterium]
MNKFVVFIDRDGTINEEAGYVDSFDRFKILPGVSDAVCKLNVNNIPAIVITNQSGIARGYFSSDFVNKLHDSMIAILKRKGCFLDDIYVCPHHPDEGCACRKPRPGMLLKAAKDHGVSLRRSFVIGDKIIDIKTAHSVGAKGILVLTGYGTEEMKGLTNQDPEDRPDHIAANLYEAVSWIIKEVMSNEQRAMSEKENKNTLPFKGREGAGMGYSGEVRRILIVKPSSLGDIIHSLPVLWALRKIYPDAFIAWVVKEVWQDVLADNPLIDRLIILKKGLSGINSAIRETRSLRFDTVIDLQGLFRSGIITFFSGAADRFGFSNAREFAPIFYNNKVMVPPGKIHAVDRYMLTISALSCPQIPLFPPLLKGERRKLQFPFYIRIEDAEWVRQFLLENNLSDKQPLIAINPSARWIKKRWPAASYSALINQLIKELKAGIIIVGSKDDIPIANEISSLVDETPGIATGKTSIRKLAALLTKVNLLITNDSGPMHIAAALGTPVAALFGPTDPELTGPYGQGHAVVRKNLDCSPCMRRPCTEGKTVCMDTITPEDVLNAVLGILKGVKHGAK